MIFDCKITELKRGDVVIGLTDAFGTFSNWSDTVYTISDVKNESCMISWNQKYDERVASVRYHYSRYINDIFRIKREFPELQYSPEQQGDQDDDL